MAGGPQLDIAPRGVPAAEDGRTVLSFAAAQGLFRMKVYLKDQNISSPVVRIRLECGADAPGLMEIECMAAFCAAAGVDREDMISVIALADGSLSLWSQMCAMKPYVRLDGVTLQGAEDGDVLIAEVYGADE